MSVRTIPTDHPVSPAQVWTGLTTERQVRVIQLLARLASDLADLQPFLTSRGPTDGDTSRLPEDPA
jgi:hypothetical protein